MRRHQPRRSSAPDRRGRRDDPLKGEAGTGNIVEAVRHLREIVVDLAAGHTRRAACRRGYGLRAPIEVVDEVAGSGWLPVPLFCAGGIVTPADAALTMQLGAEGNFVGSGIFKSEDPERRARAIVEATTHPEDPERVAAASMELGADARRHRAARSRGRTVAAPRGLGGQGQPLLPPREEAQPLRVGVLASQGDFAAHARMLEELALRQVEVRTPDDLARLDALVIPGVESTTITKAIERDGLEPRSVHHDSGRPILGTCAGMILLDREHLGLLDDRAAPSGVTLASFETDLEIAGIGPEPIRRLHPRPVDLQPWARRGGPCRGRRASRGRE